MYFGGVLVVFLSYIDVTGIHIRLNDVTISKEWVMLGLIRYFDRNKKLNELLDEYRYYSNEELAEGKTLIIESEDWNTELPLKMNELQYLNRENIGYAVVHFQEKGFCLLYDDFNKDSQAELIPFNDGKITIEGIYKKKECRITFYLSAEK